MLNKCQIIGHLGSDPEMRNSANGSLIATFNVAVNHWFRDVDGASQDQTEWYSVVVSGREAELCQQYLAKGRRVFCEGPIHTRQYQTQEGELRSATELHARTVKFLSPRTDGAPESQSQGSNLDSFESAGAEPF